MASILDLDPRWRALQERGGVMDIAFDHPAEWPHDARGEAPFVKSGDDQLSSELCRLDDDRFIRATWCLPIRGADEVVMIALWVDVAHDTFYAYIEAIDGGAAPRASLGALANDLPPLAGLDAPVTLEFNDGTERPTATVSGVEDISLDDLIALYEATGSLTRADLKG